MSIKYVTVKNDINIVEFLPAGHRIIASLPMPANKTQYKIEVNDGINATYVINLGDINSSKFDYSTSGKAGQFASSGKAGQSGVSGWSEALAPSGQKMSEINTPKYKPYTPPKKTSFINIIGNSVMKVIETAELKPQIPLALMAVVCLILLWYILKW